tara:strand:+ start:1696 stop:1899 length:204 start_codon:yes stop_codon:yes gene_type:complete
MNEENQDEWMMEMCMGHEEVRMLYNHVCYAIQTWPGSPARPAEEQEYLQILKTRLFAMLTEYTFYEK